MLAGKKRFDRGYTSEYDLVKDFLMRASRYPSVVQGEAEVASSVVLVEDLPLTFHRDPGAFHDLLWSVYVSRLGNWGDMIEVENL